MTKKKKFINLVEGKDSSTFEEIKSRIKNRETLRETQNIALKVLMKLDELNWSQKRLAKEMGVSPQQVNKIVSGKENLTTQTQITLQNILDIPVLASYYENTYDFEPILSFSSAFIFKKEMTKVELKIDEYSQQEENPFVVKRTYKQEEYTELQA